jgi:hypothetical protein
MNKVYLQIWEESERGWGIRPDGCSLHLSIKDRDNYIKSIYSERSGDAPEIYDRIVGEPIEACVSDSIYNLVDKDKSVRLMEYEMNNLSNLEEIIIKDA